MGTGLQVTIVNLVSKPGTLGWKVITLTDAGDDEMIAETFKQENARVAVVGASLFSLALHGLSLTFRYAV